MKICEIFASIQGESSRAGMPCVFVRLTGCNLRCSYCDTKYAYDEGTEMEIPAVLNAVKAFGLMLVEVTGGEPLAQTETLPLLRKLADYGYTVLLETNGSYDISAVDHRVSTILDMKTPSSGMSTEMRLGNLDLVQKKDEVKFVLSDYADYEWAKNLIRNYSLTERTTVLLAPVFRKLDPAELSEWLVRDRLNARLNLQLHKYIFDPDRRGI